MMGVSFITIFGCHPVFLFETYVRNVWVLYFGTLASFKWISKWFILPSFIISTYTGHC